MRVSGIVCLLLVGLSCVGQDAKNDENGVLQYARELDVHQLDSALPSQRLEEWLSVGPARIESTRWRLNDCDLKSDDDKPKDQPLCVTLTFVRGTVSGWALITVGTARQRIHGLPQFRYAVATSSAPSFAGRSIQIRRLSEFPQLIAQVDAEEDNTDTKE